MKRSEIVNLIEGIIYDGVGDNGVDLFPIAEKIVDEIEYVGMLPPKRKATTEDITNVTQEFIDDHEMTVNDWESEED